MVLPSDALLCERLPSVLDKGVYVHGKLGKEGASRSDEASAELDALAM